MSVGGGQSPQSGGIFDGRIRQKENICRSGRAAPVGVLKNKDLVGIPWRVAFALQADGWYLRQDVIEEVELYCPCGCGYVLEERIWRWSQDRDLIWRKPNPMPESVRDRCTKNHEYIFHLSKSDRYYFDGDAIAEPVSPSMVAQIKQGYNGSATKDYAAAGAQDPSAVKSRILKRSGNKERKPASARGVPQNNPLNRGNQAGSVPWAGAMRNKRSVWSVTAKPFAGAHFATFPPDLIEPCILAGSRPGDVVFDPFMGSGTTAEVAQRLGRQWVGCEINRDYEPLQKQRTQQLGMEV